jgi:hypothetical protein
MCVFLVRASLVSCALWGVRAQVFIGYIVGCVGEMCTMQCDDAQSKPTI